MRANTGYDLSTKMALKNREKCLEKGRLYYEESKNILRKITHD